MKAKELMIGDWVMPLQKSIRKPCQVVSTDGRTNTCRIDSDEYSGLLSCSELERIPLSTEILEKNGWISDNSNDPLRIYNLRHGNKLYSIIAIADDGKWSIEVDAEIAKKDKRGRADLVTFIRGWCGGFCVHELQHALKLCGIEKEIMI